MGGGSRARILRSLLGALLFLSLASSAPAFDFLDGRVQVHGFYEAQIRSMVRDYDLSDRWDLTQWYNVLNIEIDWDIAPDGIGPLDLISAFGRVEARYDCVWTHACGTLSSANAYGSRGEGPQPLRLRDGRRSGYDLQTFTGDTGRYQGRDRLAAADMYELGQVVSIFPIQTLGGGFTGIGGSARRQPGLLDIVPGFNTLMGSRGADDTLGTIDDPGPFYFSAVYPDCRFNVRSVDGTVDGTGTQVLPHTVNKSDCNIVPVGNMRDKPNPFNPNDSDPNVLPAGGAFALPFRPAPLYSNTQNGSIPIQDAVGVYYPSAGLRGVVSDLGRSDQNFRQTELEWNRGASQQQTKELKELFVEFEMFDSRLWVRAGKQQIVWGKTELFRTTDQFNPQDLGLGSLTSLEESRIALWSGRGVWSFYEVGPLEDVRLELALNYDEVQPTDLGRCGEPYSPLPACDLTFGMMAHGLTGLAIAGYDRPDDAWDDVSGIEVGARLEFRWDRFSFALIDFYGYDDSFWIDQNFVYSRNVDPVTGRPRHTMATGSCTTTNTDPMLGPVAEASCLLGSPVNGVDPTALDPTRNSLQFHSVNQQLFAMICATSIGFSSLDRTSCAQSVFNSQASSEPLDPPSGATIATAVSNLLAGDSTQLVFPGLIGAMGTPPPCTAASAVTGTLCNPLQVLSNDVTAGGVDTDGLPLTFAQAVAAGLNPTATDSILYGVGLQGLLTDEQQALFGCGPFYGTLCDGHGIDLLNTEASVLLQSLLGIDGTPVGPIGSVLTTDATLIQPGTVGFQGGPVCTRYQGQLYVLPGCNGILSVGADGVPDTIDEILAGTGDDTFQPDYDTTITMHDGTTTSAGPRPSVEPAAPRIHPFTGQFFRSEMSVASWNATMALVGLSAPPEFLTFPGVPFPIPTDENGDGFAEPKYIAQDQFDATTPAFAVSDGVDNDGDGLIDNPEEGDPTLIGAFRTNGCSYNVPGACSNITALGTVMGVQRNTVRAGGNGTYGRRDFVWAGGSEVVLRFDKRNVLGLSMDFAEDMTKTNWGVEFTWIPNIPTTNNDEFDGISETDQFNLTISVDRPTFINFLNQNRTFFITTQWFMRYLKDYENGMPGAGPWSVLAILNASTGYFQDRLLPGVTFVYDFRSNSAAVLPSVGYRFTENFSATFGFAIFSGRTEERTTALTPISLGNRVGEGAYKSHVDRGLSLIRERDEIFLRVRYTF